MKKYFAILLADIKNTKRDPTLLLMLLVPFLLLVLVRFALPLLNQWLPDIAAYYLQILTFFALLISIFPGFILSFMLLDEKDSQLLSIIKVTPVSLSGFLATRVVFVVILGFLFSFMFLYFNGLVHFPLLFTTLLSLLSALNGPILILLISSVAKNKIEGMTFLKVANITLFIPVAAFFIQSLWEYGLGFLPAFWVFKIADSFALGLPLLGIGGIGLAMLLFLNYLSFRFCLKRLSVL
ncbi:MAG: hypothetical protein WCX31_12760 [Salinivirgaceae bacterium]|jgi:hypothetical protein